ncbi:MAG: polymerase [Polaromonas sp.]|nr:polymerase [Polaromonas sp.]
MQASRTFFVPALLAAAALAACGGSDDDSPRVVVPPVAVAVGDTVALTVSGNVLSFDRAAPATLKGSIAVSGLQTNEKLVGIDMRPADGLLYVLSNQARLYTLNASTGVATFKAALSAATGDDNPYTALTGSQFGLDFNPVADRLRVISDTGLNLRIDVATGAATTDGVINGAATAAITAAAYTNSVAGTTSTQLFSLDAAAGNVYLQDPPNNGTLTAPIGLGGAFSGANGFDIDAHNNIAYAALTTGGSTALYTVPLAAGSAAVRVGAIGTGEALTGLALMQPKAVKVYALTEGSRLASFDPAAPATLTASLPISGLVSGESVLGIDFRPANGRLYALTSTARLLTLDPDTGASTVVATLSADAADTTLPYAGLGGAVRYTVDFNPFADRLRVVSDSGLNLRINADTGATTTDGVINRAGVPPVVAGGAYTNSFAGSRSTVLYDLDAASAVLAQQNPPNDGTLVNVGALNMPFSGAASMDIAGGANGLVLAALRAGASGPYTLYTVSLTTGAATLFRNTTGDATRSLIGGSAGPALLDIAIML